MSNSLRRSFRNVLSLSIVFPPFRTTTDVLLHRIAAERAISHAVRRTPAEILTLVVDLGVPTEGQGPLDPGQSEYM
jgi:hypothetical protein